MGDCFEKLGRLLSDKIQKSEENENFEEQENNVTSQSSSEKDSADSTSKEKKISPELLLSALKNKPSATGEVVPSGTYEEDVPVKIITGEAEFK